MLFAHLKRILKLDRLRLRGPNGAHDEFVLAATAQNLRNLAKLSRCRSQNQPETRSVRAVVLALQLQFPDGSESMGDHNSGFDDWWSVGRRYADAVGFFVARGQATDSSAVYAGSGRDLGWAVSRWTVGQRAAQDGLDESGGGR